MALCNNGDFQMEDCHLLWG